MKDWKNTLLSPESTILDAVSRIDASGLQIALVLDEEGRLVGTVTDGDVRRGILRGISLEQPVTQIMNKNPKVAKSAESAEEILQRMTTHSLHQIPVVDEGGKVLRIEVIENLLKPETKENIVVLIAGGLGTRLRPLTEDFPKPLLKVGARPIMETIVENFIEYGFRRFYVSVNYKSELIEEHFGDGKKWGAEFHYIHEKTRMGTAGSLSLLPQRPDRSFFVMNADLLTKVNFQHLMDFHHQHKAVATMCVRQYDFQVPYGVVKLDDHSLTGIQEKPVQHFFINAGIYVLEPEALNYIPKNQYFDMPTLFENLIKEKKSTTAFPIREYWLDIGQKNDFDRANIEFPDIFGD